MDRGRFTAVAYPRDSLLAASLLERAVGEDSFPGLPEPRERVLIAVAPDRRRFRRWVGPDAPRWGAAVALPEESRIVVQGSAAGSDAGDPRQVLRHELAHLALHEALGDVVPRWFDEGYAGYAAGEWGRDEVLSTSVRLLVRGAPPLDSLDAGFAGGANEASAAYALSQLAVADLATLDQARGLTTFLREWRVRGSMDAAVRAAYGITLADFETLWRRRVQRRYGALALVANVGLGAGLMALLAVPLFLARRRRDRLRLAAMRQEEERAEQHVDTPCGADDT